MGAPSNDIVSVDVALMVGHPDYGSESRAWRASFAAKSELSGDRRSLGGAWNIGVTVACPCGSDRTKPFRESRIEIERFETYTRVHERNEYDHMKTEHSFELLLSFYIPEVCHMAGNRCGC